MTAYIFDSDKFREELKRNIKRRGGYRKFAKECGMSLGRLQGYVKGTYSPRVDDFIAICNFMSIEPYYFIDDDWYQKRMF